MQNHVDHSVVPERKSHLFLLLPIVLLIMVGCSETGVDPDTATVIGNDLGDTIPELDLQKGVVKVGFLGDNSGNTVVENFVQFEHRVRYKVDTLDDGSPVALKGVLLQAVLDDDEDAEDVDFSNPFHPLRRLTLAIPSIDIRPNGTGTVAILGDPAARALSTAAISVGLRRGDDEATLNVRPNGPAREAGEVRVTSVNPGERLISLSVNVELHHDRVDRLPGRVIISILLELPY